MTEEQLASKGLTFVVESEVWRFSYVWVDRPHTCYVDITPLPNKVIDGAALKHVATFIRDNTYGTSEDKLTPSINWISIVGWSTYVDTHTPKFVYDGEAVRKDVDVDLLACVFGLTVESTEKIESESEPKGSDVTSFD